MSSPRLRVLLPGAGAQRAGILVRRVWPGRFCRDALGPGRWFISGERGPGRRQRSVTCTAIIRWLTGAGRSSARGVGVILLSQYGRDEPCFASRIRLAVVSVLLRQCRRSRY